MVDFRSALKRPFSDKKTLLISLFLSLLSTILLPLIIGLAGILLLSGLAGTTAKNTLTRRPTLTQWQAGNLGEFFLTGIKLFLIKLFYGLIGLIVMSIAAIIFAFTVFSSKLDSIMLSSAIISFGTVFLVGLALFLLGMLFMPMAAMNFLDTGSLKSAFSFRKILRKTISKKFFGALIFLTAYAILLALVGSIISILTIGIGTILLPGIFLYLYMVCLFEVFAQVFRETS